MERGGCVKKIKESRKRSVLQTLFTLTTFAEKQRDVYILCTLLDAFPFFHIVDPKQRWIEICNFFSCCWTEVSIKSPIFPHNLLSEFQSFRQQSVTISVAYPIIGRYRCLCYRVSLSFCIVSLLSRGWLQSGHACVNS